MRVSQEIYFHTVSPYLMRLQNRQLQTQEGINTKKRVNQPFDGRETSYTTLSSSLAITLVSQYKTNMSQAQTWMKCSDTAMQSLPDLTKRAQVLAEQMFTGTYESADQLTTFSEVQNIIHEINRASNTKTKDF